MEVIELDDSKKQEYIDFLVSQPNNTFLQTWAWGDWQKLQGKIVNRYFFIDENKNILGCAQTILMRTPLGNYFYCPYGPIWKTNPDKEKSENEITKSLELFCNKLKQQNKSLFLRMEPIQKINLSRLGAVKASSIQPPQTLIKNIFSPDNELISSFHQKTRYNIRVAQRHNVSVESFTQPDKQVIDLITQTSERQNYRNHSTEYINALWNFFANNQTEIKVTGYLAKKDAAPLASGLMIDFGKTRMYLFGGSNYTLRNFMGPYLMHWQAILDAKKIGLGFYDFGAAEDASGHTGGYTRFKMGFNPEIVEFSGTHDIVFRKNIYTIYRSLRKANRIRLHLPFIK